MACCNDFSRSQLLRSSVAKAGQGLPAIEFGMPTPGRHRTHAPLDAARLGGHVPDRLRRRQDGRRRVRDRHRRGLLRPGRSRSSSAIFLPGGMDGISVLAPVYDPNYQTLRTTTKMDEAGTLAVNGLRTCAGTRRPRRSRTCTTPAR